MKDSKVNYKEGQIKFDITRLKGLIEKLRVDTEMRSTERGYFLLYEFAEDLGARIYEGWQECSFTEWYAKSVKIPLTLLQIELKRLQRLLSSLKSYQLSRTLIDRKSAFRTKVQLLFKNLDDAHITKIVPRFLRKTFSCTHAIPIRWNRIKYKRLCASQL